MRAPPTLGASLVHASSATLLLPAGGLRDGTGGSGGLGASRNPVSSGDGAVESLVQGASLQQQQMQEMQEQHDRMKDTIKTLTARLDALQAGDEKGAPAG